MNIKLKPNAAQRAVIEHPQSCTVIGPAGSGKTQTLFWKIKALIKQGTAPADIAILCFSYRNLLLMRHLAGAHLGTLAQKITIGTVVDLPLEAMKAALNNKGPQGEAATEPPHELPRVADNNFMRRLLRQSMVEVGFAGHVNEAEHLVRTFKSHAKKPNQNEAHYDLFHTYKQHLDQTGLVDRHDVVRKHIIGMRNDVYQPIAAKHIFVDHFQDITEIQALWLVDHLKAGKHIYAFGCDDLTIFSRDGAKGVKAFNDFEELNDVPRFTLEEVYRTPTTLFEKSQALLKPIKGRLYQKAAPYHEGGQFQLISAQTTAEELAKLVTEVRSALQKREVTVGILTRYDLQARQVERALAANNIAHTSFARSIWETPGATLVLDLLALFLDQSTKSRLRNIFSAFGLTNQTIEVLYTNGLNAEGWLGQGAPMPEAIDGVISVSQLRILGQLRQKLVEYGRMMPKVGPKVVFKALVLTLFEHLKEEEKRSAVFALDELLTTKGNLKQIIKTLTEHRQPDPGAQVIVAPVRESRNMAFDHVFIPFVTAENYPYKYKVLPKKEGAGRRLMHMAVTRSSNAVTLLYTAKNPSPYIKEWL